MLSGITIVLEKMSPSLSVRSVFDSFAPEKGADSRAFEAQQPLMSDDIDAFYFMFAEF